MNGFFLPRRSETCAARRSDRAARARAGPIRCPACGPTALAPGFGRAGDHDVARLRIAEHILQPREPGQVLHYIIDRLTGGEPRRDPVPLDESARLSATCCAWPRPGRARTPLVRLRDSRWSTTATPRASDGADHARSCRHLSYCHLHHRHRQIERTLTATTPTDKSNQ